MLTLVTCNQCGESMIALDATSVNVVLSRHSSCEKCHHSHSDTRDYFFCSEKCFNLYLVAVVNGEKNFDWKEHNS